MFDQAEKLKSEIADLRKQLLLWGSLVIGSIAFVVVNQFLEVPSYLPSLQPIRSVVGICMALFCINLLFKAIDNLQAKYRELNRIFASPGLYR